MKKLGIYELENLEFNCDAQERDGHINRLRHMPAEEQQDYIQYLIEENILKSSDE